MSDGVMIAFLPTDGSWCKQDLPHMTLVYAGTTDELAPTAFNELAKDAVSVARLTGPFTLDILGVDVFGDEPKVDVLRLHPTARLLTARQLVERWNASEYKEFSPHATVGPEGSAEGDVPPQLYFDRIMVGWGYKRLVFPLNR